MKQYQTAGEKKTDAGFEVTEATELMKFLLDQIPHKSRNNIKTLLKNKQILVDGSAATQYNHPLSPGQRVAVRWERVPEEKQYRGITIIYEDSDLIVIDKHAGLLSIATNDEKQKTAYSMLSKHVKKARASNKIFIVHRIDRETSGLMMFAKREKVQQLLQESWHTIIKERTYIALTEGAVEKTEDVITSYLKESSALMVYSSQNPDYGYKAVTHYQTIKKNKNHSLLKVNLETGRKNQIRVHMKDIGHTIVGDKKYGSTINPIGRLGLHAWVLAFTHPISKKELRFENQIPRKFLRLF